MAGRGSDLAAGLVDIVEGVLGPLARELEPGALLEGSQALLDLLAREGPVTVPVQLPEQREGH